MLGAYQPSPNMIDAVQGSIESLTAAYYPVFATITDASRGDPEKRLMAVHRPWLERNLQPLMDMFVADWNRKNPSKGRLPRIQTIVQGVNPGYDGVYNPNKNTITIFSYLAPRGAEEYNHSGKFVTDPVLYAARNTAAQDLGIIFHEFLHATQSELYLTEKDSQNSALAREELLYKGPTYRTKKMEIASYALTHMLPSAVITPRRIYRDEDLKRILSFLIATKADVRSGLDEIWILAAHKVGVDFDFIRKNTQFPEVIDSYPPTEDGLLYEIYRESLQTQKVSDMDYKPTKGKKTDDDLDYVTNPLRRYLLKNRGEMLVRDEFKRPRDNRLSRPLFEQFKRNFEPYMQLQLRNIRRRIHNFQSINEHFGLSNKSLYKPDYYALKF